MRRLALLLPLALASTGMICGGSPGALQNPREGVFAATDAQVHVIDERGAQVRVRVDGGGRVELFPPGYRLTASDDAGALFVLSDSDTNLYIGPPGQPPRRIPELDRRLSDACLTADSSAVVAIRHADFSLPQAQWVDDDAVYVVDVATAAVRVIPATSTRWPVKVGCLRDDPGVVWLTLQEGGDVRVDLATGARTPGEAPQGRLFRPPTARIFETCPIDQSRLELRGWRGDEGVDLVRPDGARTHLVQIRGRRRGFHDYLPTVETPTFTPDCRHVLFGFEGTLYVTDVQSRVTRPLLIGGGPFFLTAG